jgi:hypothetical protein
LTVVPETVTRARRPWHHAVLWLLLAVTVVLGFSVAGHVGLGPGGGAPAAGSTTQGTRPVATDGQLTFTLTGYRCGIHELGRPPATTQPHGQFCVFNLAVRNSGSLLGWVMPWPQRLVDTRGRQYAAATGALAYDPAARNLDKPLWSGDSTTGHLIFDIPAGSTPRQLIVHDTPFSDGTPLPVRSSRTAR